MAPGTATSSGPATGRSSKLLRLSTALAALLVAAVLVGCGGPKAVTEKAQKDETEAMQKNSPDMAER